MKPAQTGWCRALTIILGAQLAFWSIYGLVAHYTHPVKILASDRLPTALDTLDARQDLIAAYAPGLAGAALLRVPGWQPALLHPAKVGVLTRSEIRDTGQAWSLICLEAPCGQTEHVYVGALDRIGAAAARERFQRFDTAWLGIAAALVLGIGLIVLLPISRFSRLQTVTGLFLILLSADLWLTVFGQSTVYGLWFPLLRYGIEYPMLTSMALTINAFAGWRPREAWVAGACCALIFGVLIVTALTGHEVENIATMLDAAAIILLLGYGIIALLRLRRAAPGPAIRILALLLIVLISAAYDLLFQPMPYGTAPMASVMAAPLVMFGLIFELAIQGHQLNREADEALSDLEHQVLEQDANLLRSSSLLRHQERRLATDAERQRLLRDMHDGVGGVLTHLLLDLRARDLSRQEIEQGLQSAIDDLRNMASVIEAGHEPIDQTLAMFHERMAPRLARSGITFDYRCALPMPAPGLDMRRLLNLYRLLQEGVANALRHASATRIELHAQLADGDSLLVTLSDNGAGFVPEHATGSPGEGRGLANMRRRAEQMNGRLHIESAPGQGTRLRLTIPLAKSPPPGIRD
ncbi:MAG: hypothetical protein LBV44_07860 [Methylobacillus sp.]|jgi:signal transduction histidine kinase|nr:hypothetical protein [Methylobacillus sp.]